MNDVIEFRIQLNTLSGHTATQYLGSEPVVDINYGVTEALRSFNLPNAVAPGEWPNPHENITTDVDPRGRG